VPFRLPKADTLSVLIAKTGSGKAQFLSFGLECDEPLLLI